MIGHQAVRAYLEHTLPAASLLHGPASVGKWTLAAHLARHHQVSPIDRWDAPHGLAVDTVRLVTDYTRRAPQGQFKLIIARLEQSSRHALHALLKTLEEPPPYVRFLLTSSEATLPTVASRCHVFELGMLSAPELEQIYRARGMTAARAERAARFARGQVERGLTAERVEAQRSQVAALIKALQTCDIELFDSVFTGWDAGSTEMLSRFFTEALTHRWEIFAEQDAHGLHHTRQRLWSVVNALGQFPRASPRLGVRAALEPFLNRT